MGHESQDMGKNIAPYEDDAGYHCSYSEGDKEVYVTFHGDDEQFDHVEKDEELENATSNEPEENFLESGRVERCPQIGMEFGSAEDAYSFYNQYAGKMGFSVRKYSTCKSHRTSETIGRTYCCSLQGLRDVRAKRLEERIRNRANIRTGCRALISIRKRKGDTWVVSRVVEEHNHKLAALSERHTLRSLRKIAMDQRRVIENMCLTGLNTDLVTNYMALEARGSAKSGTGGEVRKFLSTKQQRGPTEVDVGAILHYFECQQMDNPSFVYSIQVDSVGRMTNFFWTDGRSRMDYHYFGDVVCLDPSSGANKYGLPFVPIVGINHHCQTVLFGGALLYTESEESFEWVIKTWIRSMNGKQPKVILTDQESAIGEVIVRLLPGTRHQYCAWHISRDLMKNLPHVIHSHKSFTRDFDHCLYGSETIEDFESNWVAMVTSYNLGNDNWLMKLYENRETWAPVYIRDVFSASKFITQHGERLNAYFDGHVKMNMTLFEFLKQYERAVVARREAENDEDFETNHRKRVLRFSMDIEKDAARIYTRSIFENFQNELFEGLSYRHKKVEEIGMKSMYNVWKLGQENMRRIVTFNSFDSSAKCSCQLFESAGYFCRHILKVFVVEDVQTLPPQYILKRWTNDAKFGPLVNDDQVGEILSNLDEIVSVRFSKICQEAINIAVKGSTSLEVYKVAMSGLHNALRAVESVMKNGTVCPTVGNKEVESVHSYEGSSGDRSADRRNNLIHLL